MDYYTAWVNAELQWTEPFQKLRRRLWKKALWTILLIFLAGSAAVFFALQAEGSSDALNWAIFFLLMGLLVMGLLALCMLQQTGRRFFKKRLRKSVRRLLPEQRKDLARDLLEAMDDTRRTFTFIDESPGQNQAPCRFLMGRRWVFLTNGWDYTPFIVPLRGVKRFSTGEDVLTVGKDVIRLYYIYFEGTNNVLRFHDAQNRSRALTMLWAQMPKR